MINFVLLYVLGYFVSIILFCVNNRKNDIYKTDLNVAMFISIFSWMTVIALLCSAAYGSDWFWRLNKRFKGE